MPTTTYFVAHSIPGRIRVKVAALKYEPMLAAGLEKAIRTECGVSRVSANADSTSVTIEFVPEVFDPVRWLDRLDLANIEPCHPSRSSSALPGPLAALRRGTFAFESKVTPRTQFLLGSAALLATMIGAPPVITRCILTAAILPIANRAVQTLLYERRLGAEALDAISCLVLTRSGGFFPASVMTFLIGFGEFVRDSITHKCEALIEHQLALSLRAAWLIKGKKRLRSPVIDLRPGDRLVVYQGELISFYGIVDEGSGTVVPADPEMDFEPTPVHVGDFVYPGTILAAGKIYARYEKCLHREEEDLILKKQKKRWLQRTRVHRRGLKIGYERIWPIMGFAALLFAATQNIHRAMTIICFDFITGIRITLPIAVLSSMYKAGLAGVVIRNASALERLAAVDVIIFARSGTLTELNPSVTQVHVSDGHTLEAVTRFAGAVEQRYNHLAAYAIYSFAEVKNIPVPERISSCVVNGLGVRGNVEGHSVLVGSTRLMELENVDLTSATKFLQECMERADSRACVAIDGKLAGVIAYQDPLRADAKDVISELRALGISDIVMTTGAIPSTAEKLAKEAGITTVFSRHTAQDKADLVKKYQRQGHKVAVVGSDVNDALALEIADVAITLGTGTEIARHRADVVLDSDELSGLTDAIRTARDGMALVNQNLILVSAPNWLGLGMSLLSGTEVLAATLLNNGSVLIGAINGLRPLLSLDDDRDRDGLPETETAIEMRTVAV